LNSFFSSGLEDGDVTETDLETDVWQEQGPWLLLLLVPVIVMVFRRGVLVLIVMMCLPYPQDAGAIEWDAMWLRVDQRAKQVLDAGQAETAAELFEDLAWKGAAYYRAGNFDDAVKHLQEVDGIENKYNLGNALARKGMLEQAIALYTDVLGEDPEHEDAKYNKELLEKELQQQQQQQQQQQPQESFSDQDKQQQNQSQDESQQEQAQQQTDKQDEQDPNQEQQLQETEQQSDTGVDQQPEEEMTDPGQLEPLQANQDRIDEEKQATEQWLRRIPDNPGGLLRRKFLLQYQKRQHDRVPGEKLW